MSNEEPFSRPLAALAVVMALGVASPEVADVSDSATIGSSHTNTMEKKDGAGPSGLANQDQLTENAWINRGNDGGKNHNAATETDVSQGASPKGTE